jgi:type IX secretion system PorP/SprF family membrane protein
MKSIPYIFCFLLMICGLQSRSQSPQFSQQYASPLLLNPALCGENRGTRFMLNARNQWATVAGGYRTYAVGADHFVPSMNAGIGMSVMRDIAGVNRLATTNISVYYAHKVRISKTQAIKAGIRLSQVLRSIDFTDVVCRSGGPGRRQRQHRT